MFCASFSMFVPFGLEGAFVLLAGALIAPRGRRGQVARCYSTANSGAVREGVAGWDLPARLVSCWFGVRFGPAPGCGAAAQAAATLAGAAGLASFWTLWSICLASATASATRCASAR